MNRASITRHTGPLVTNTAEIARIEARNALLQFDEVCRMARQRFGDLRLTPEDVCALQKLAVQGIFACAGSFREIPIGISNTPHEPPPWQDVPRLVGEMCGYANAECKRPFHTSAYLMWRLNWIHPFADGNGRTSRVVSYLALCAGLEMELPGKVTIPELIATKYKTPYYEALDSADASLKAGCMDVSQMEALIAQLLKEQLTSA